MSDIFISYAREDIDKARRLAEALEAQGWSVFWDRTIPPGLSWRSYIGKALDEAGCVIVTWSAASIDSEFVHEEADEAKERDVLIPVLIESVKPPIGFRSRQAADLIGWDGNANVDSFAILMNSVNMLMGTRRAVAKTKNHQPGSDIPVPELVRIPSGSFEMGSEDGDTSERPVHPVTIAEDFYLSATAITFDQYDAFADATDRKPPGDQDWGRANRPVINVSWDDANAYCAWLSERTGKTFRLPSEAEWEYAARAETTTRYGLPAPDGGDDLSGLANTDGNKPPESLAADLRGLVGKQTLPVGSFPPNAWGLYDMHGNVWEWVQDCWHKNYDHAPDDGSAWLEGDGGDCRSRVLRGGSWNILQYGARSAIRYWGFPNGRNYGLGFRVLCSSPID